MPKITIPPAALEAGADEVIDIAECEERCERIRRSYEGTPCKCREVARAAIAAGLAAWPMAEMPHVENAPAFIILPLTENPDA